MNRQPLLTGLGWLPRGAAYALFFLMLFTPTAYVGLKAPLLVFVVITVLLMVSWKGDGTYAVHRSIVLWTVLLAGTGAAYSVLGIGQRCARRRADAHGLCAVATGLLLLVGALLRWQTIESFVKLMNYALLAISAYCLMFILYSLGIWPPLFMSN